MRLDTDTLKQVLMNFVLSIFLGFFWGFVSLLICLDVVISLLIMFGVILVFFPMMYYFQSHYTEDTEVY